MNSLELDAGEIVWVTFLGPQALNVSFDIIGINNGESATPVYIGSGGDIHQLEAIGGNGVGTAAITWDAVPTPSSSLLVLVGSGSLILRRRRGWAYYHILRTATHTRAAVFLSAPIKQSVESLIDTHKKTRRIHPRVLNVLVKARAISLCRIF